MPKKLRLERATIVSLGTAELQMVAGGGTSYQRNACRTTESNCYCAMP